MSKGLSLLDFRAQLESDAMKRCEQQEVTIKELTAQVKSLQSHIQAMLENEKRDAKTIDRLKSNMVRVSDKDFIEKGILFMERTSI